MPCAKSFAYISSLILTMTLCERYDYSIFIEKPMWDTSLALTPLSILKNTRQKSTKSWKTKIKGEKEWNNIKFPLNFRGHSGPELFTNISEKWVSLSYTEKNSLLFFTIVGEISLKSIDIYKSIFPFYLQK